MAQTTPDASRRLGPFSSPLPSIQVSLLIRHRLIVVLLFVAVVRNVATWQLKCYRVGHRRPSCR